MSFQVQVSHGSDRHAVEVQSADSVVADLKTTLLTLTQIPIDSQKLIFKGKTLQDDYKTVSELGIKQGSRLMVLGRKSAVADDPSSKEVEKFSCAVDGIARKMEGIREEVTGIEKGFLQTELIADACRGLHKRCLACGELLMQNLEKLDSMIIPPTETLIRGRKKSTVVRIQSLLTRNDDLIKRIDAI
ncbi:BAG family molecular chaperone regulator 1-like [Halichondria panicea]|uniref:BAG family molecular chaperone regulator 1-like n=1 Tax=Halichondria panicea TaxID=6063 RepID=UPI00312BB12C